MLISSQMKQLTSRGGTRSAERLLELVGLDPKRAAVLSTRAFWWSAPACSRYGAPRSLLVICDEPTTALRRYCSETGRKLLNDLSVALASQ